MIGTMDKEGNYEEVIGSFNGRVVAV